MRNLAKPPKTTDGIVVELSTNLRAVIYGRNAAMLLVRGSETFALDDLEAAKLDAAREIYLAPGRAERILGE